MSSQQVSISNAHNFGLDDCWNHMGIHGDASCQELVIHVHCRNCPVYSHAAIKLLNRDLPADYLDDWTCVIAQEGVSDKLDTQSALIFRIGAEWLALTSFVLDEIVDQRPIHELPQRGNGIVLGLVNVRGELLICVSLSEILRIGTEVESSSGQPGSLQPRLLVTRTEGGRIVCPVDEVHGIHRFNSHDLREIPATLSNSSTPYTKAIIPWRNKSVGWLDDQLLFYTINRNLA